jgi:hypothetical protein
LRTDAPIKDIISHIPTELETYFALLACGALSCANKPPQPPVSEAGKPTLRRALHDAFCINPRGIRCPVAGACKSRVCHEYLTACAHSQIVACIYEIVLCRCGTKREPSCGVAASMMTDANIAQIDIDELRDALRVAVHDAECERNPMDSLGSAWCSTWAMYLNSRAHVESFNHTCTADCTIMARGRDADTEELRGLIDAHRVMYEHEPRGFARPRGGRDRHSRGAYSDGASASAGASGGGGSGSSRGRGMHGRDGDRRAPRRMVCLRAPGEHISTVNTFSALSHDVEGSARGRRASGSAAATAEMDTADSGMSIAEVIKQSSKIASRRKPT